MNTWRVGRSLGRTLYIQRGDEPAKGDQVIGMVDTPELAELIVTAVNTREEILRRIDTAEQLLAYALHMRTNGEKAPGGTETWKDFDHMAETYFRDLKPRE